MDIVCLDLEGVLIPEIWIAFAEETGIEALRATTRDIADYDELMTMRLETLRTCLLYTSPSPRDKRQSRMPSSA